MHSKAFMLFFRRNGFLFFLFKALFESLFESLFDSLFDSFESKIAKAKCKADIDFFVFFRRILCLNCCISECMFMIAMFRRFIFDFEKLNLYHQRRVRNLVKIFSDLIFLSHYNSLQNRRILFIYLITYLRFDFVIFRIFCEIAVR